LKFGYQRQSGQLFLILGLIGVITYLFISNYQKEEALLATRRQLSKKVSSQAGKNQKLQKFNLTGFDNQGKKFWNLEGETAKIEPSQTVFLEQNVTLRLKDNTVITTDKVEWSQSKGTLVTNAPVFVEHENAKIKGIGARGRPAENFVQLNRHIEMLINESTRISCRGPMKIYYNENRMIFYRNVRIRDSRGVLTARRMDVTFDPQTKKIDQVVASGDVVIVRGSDKSRSKKAIYTVATGAVRLEGNPEITIQEDSSKVLDGTFRS
jgi:lipopolysaccharide export system protein LptA